MRYISALIITIMKSFPVFFVLLFASFNVLCQSKIDTQLQKDIKSMFTEDQKWRIESQNLNYGKSSAYQETTIDRNMTITDSLNMIKAKAVVTKYGFPGFDLVGEEQSNDFWAIIQHCDNDVKF